jgi:hypothetical protein
MFLQSRYLQPFFTIINVLRITNYIFTITVVSPLILDEKIPLQFFSV